MRENYGMSTSHVILYRQSHLSQSIMNLVYRGALWVFRQMIEIHFHTLCEPHDVEMNFIESQDCPREIYNHTHPYVP